MLKPPSAGDTTTATLTITAVDHTLGSGGFVEGDDNTRAIVSIPSGRTLSSTATITGNLTINGAGTFLNAGIVRADTVNGTLTVAVTGTVDDVLPVVTRWTVANTSGAKLHFASSIGTLNALIGNFSVLNGVLEIDKALETSGALAQSAGTVQVDESTTMGTDSVTAPAHLNMTGGVIQVAAGKTFTHK